MLQKQPRKSAWILSKHGQQNKDRLFFRAELPGGWTPLTKLSLMAVQLWCDEIWHLLMQRHSSQSSSPLLDDYELFVAELSWWCEANSASRGLEVSGVPAAAAAEGGALRLCRSCRPACIYDVLSLQAAAAAWSCRRYWCVDSWKRGHTQSQFHYSSAPSVNIPQREVERGVLIKARGSSLWPAFRFMEQCLYSVSATWNALYSHLRTTGITNLLFWFSSFYWRSQFHILLPYWCLSLLVEIDYLVS